MKRAIVLAIAALTIAGGIALWAWLHRPPPAIVTSGLVGDTQVVTIEKPVLVPGDVAPYVADRTEAERLIRDLEAAHAQVQLLSETVARLQAQGGGPATTPDGKPAPAMLPPIRWGDWRIDIQGQPAGQTYVLSYQLHQQLEVEAAVGKDQRGGTTAAVRLFEIGPGAVRTEIRDAKTIVVVANPTAARWRLGLNVQAGIAGTMAGLQERPRAGAVVGLQLLRRGSSPAAEDNAWSVGTPVVYLGGPTVEIGLLPVSVNLGRLPRQPFRDLWLSPLVTRSRAGVALTATF